MSWLGYLAMVALRPHGTGGRLWGVTLGVKSKYPSQNKRKNQTKTKNIAENKATNTERS